MKCKCSPLQALSHYLGLGWVFSFYSQRVSFHRDTINTRKLPRYYLNRKMALTELIMSCHLTSTFLLNFLLHNSQLSVFPSEWTNFICVCMCGVWENFCGQNLHWYGFSPVWSLLWMTRFCFWANVFLQVVQLKGLSPVWVRSWICNVSILFAF